MAPVTQSPKKSLEPITKLPKKLTAPGNKIDKKRRRGNPVAMMLDNEHKKQQREAREQRLQNQPQTKKSSAGALKCPSDECKDKESMIEGGTCKRCGRVIEDSDIVAEVQFGETSSGAAVVQGSYLSADQGAARIMGGPRRQAGHGSGEAREKSIRDAKMMIQGWSHTLRIKPHILDRAYRIFRLASEHNFVQGRKFQNVVAVCLYAACRHDKKNNIMLIDLAEIVKEDVFHLGRMFKAMVKNHIAGAVEAVYPEELLFRFAAKSELGDQTSKIAHFAVRILRRMDQDWMVMGRRPSSLCAAALIIAAGAWGYRRLPGEMSYITKITSATIGERLREFAETPAASLSFGQFEDDRELPTAQHDPPSVYKKTAEYLEKKEASRKRKRVSEEKDDDDSTPDDGDQDPGSPLPTPAPSPRIDKDGFAIPAPPQKGLSAELSGISDFLLNQTVFNEQGIAVDADMELDHVARQFGDSPLDDIVIDVDELDETEANAHAQSSDPDVDGPPRKKQRCGPGQSSNSSQSEERPTTPKPTAPQAKRPEPKFDLSFRTKEWTAEEAQMAAEITDLEKMMEERINDPDDALHQFLYSETQHIAAAKKAAALEYRSVPVSDDVEIGEDEFKDDAEIAIVVLDPEDPADKEEIADRARNWLNANKKYLVEKQAKDFRKERAGKKPTKERKPRNKQAPIGQRQTEPAESVQASVEATIAARSMKLNPKAYEQIFADLDRGSRMGSEASGSRASSVAPATEDDSTEKPTSFGGLQFAQRDQDTQEPEEEEDEHNADGSQYDQEETFEDEIDPFADDYPGDGDDE